MKTEIIKIYIYIYKSIVKISNYVWKLRLRSITKTGARALIGQKPMFYQSIKHKKRVLLFCGCKIYILKQTKKPKPCITLW